MRLHHLLGLCIIKSLKDYSETWYWFPSKKLFTTIALLWPTQLSSTFLFTPWLYLSYSIPGEDSPKEAPSPRISCPQGSRAYGSYCYALFRIPQTWFDAEVSAGMWKVHVGHGGCCVLFSLVLCVRDEYLNFNIACPLTYLCLVIIQWHLQLLFILFLTQLACQKRPSGHLVSVLTGAEASFLSSLVKSTGNSYSYVWIGLHDPTLVRFPFLYLLSHVIIT